MTVATCDMGFEHEEAVPEPVIAEADPGPNENDVKIAEIDAAARIETEKLYTEQRGMELEGEVQRLRGELGGMRTVLETLAPPEPAPVPEPVPVPVPVPDAPGDNVPPPPPPPDTGPKPGKSKPGWWDGYR